MVGGINIGGLLYSLLKPIARLCVRRGVKFQDLLDSAKLAMLHAAQEELAEKGSAQSVSKLSVVSGLQRSDINKRINQKSSHSKERSLLARVIGLWSESADFIDDRGAPRALSLEGKNSEFHTLIGRVSRELNPYAVLFELERSKLAVREGENLRLVSQSYIAEADVEEAARMLCGDIEDLIRAVEENTFNKPATPNLHLKVQFDNIAQDAVAEIKKHLLKEGADFIQRTQHYLARFDKDLNTALATKKGGARIALGVFSVDD
jgi:hypothetical protein